MRTTLTLDDDVAIRLRNVSRETGLPFKQIVNEHLRMALGQKKEQAQAPFIVKTRPTGLRPGISLDSISDLIDRLDGPLAR